MQVLDHLLAGPSAFHDIRGKGCDHPVFKVVRVVRSKQRQFEALRRQHYHVLKLFVVLPASPSDYLSTADVSGQHIPISFRVPVADQVTSNPKRRRLALTAALVAECPAAGQAALNPNADYLAAEHIKTVQDDTADKNKLDTVRKPHGLTETDATDTKELFSISWCQGWHWDIAALRLDLHYGLDMQMRGEFTFKWEPFGK